jgi:ankyrin repeat protein
MAHAEGWIEAYELLDEGSSLPRTLLNQVLTNRNGLGESMLHWYAIEGDVDVVEKIIALGFDVDTTNSFGRTPLFECVTIDRWDIVEILLAHGARADIKDQNDEDVFDYLEDGGRTAQVKKLKELTRHGS